MEDKREDITTPILREVKYRIFNEELNGNKEISYDLNKMNFDDFINQRLSGIGFYNQQFRAFSEYYKYNDFLRYYYNDISSNLSSLNYMISELNVNNIVRRLLLNTILDIVSVIEYEFEWIPKETIEKIKQETLKCSKTIAYNIHCCDINSIYYVALSIFGKTEDQITEKDDAEFEKCIVLAAGPVITILSAKAAVILSSAIYEALFNTLYGQFNQHDFDLIANEIGEMLLLFRNDIDNAIARYIVEACEHRLDATPFILDNTKQLCEELGIPFNHDVTGYVKY